MKKFTDESMFEIIDYLEKFLQNNQIVSFEVLNPDIGIDNYSGKKIQLEEEYIYHSYKSWTDLAELMFCKMYTPTIITKNTICLKFKKLDISNSFHKALNDEKNEKYGVESDFSKINKNEEPAFLFPYQKALIHTKVYEKKQILNLGVNRADEFEIIKNIVYPEVFEKIKFIGIDYSKSAIEEATKRFPSENFEFYSYDINKLDELNLAKSDLIISIGTLQSSNIDFKLVFMSLIQNYLEVGGSIILGFPNCRWIESDMIYGAKNPTYSYPEQSLLYKDVYFCKKYLQQKKFKVTLTGKNYLFLTATSIKKH
ncbi:methyltransferase domain-containing protein [Poseidonibacter antarcticus]|uniref:methyltransferase domain-containing protein n=1 Tax=Poseidonibacter antarcticus TaxID=2478538 RepID=UPI000EF47A35|nr:methyltransferase domain-containing protein [Poseidonibacter antarcticus]